MNGILNADDLRQREPRKTARYPWKTLEVGDRILILGNPATVQSASHHWGKSHGRRFKTRSVMVNGERGIRVERIA